MMKAGVDHDMLDNFFGNERPEFTGNALEKSLLADPSLKHMFLSDDTKLNIKTETKKTQTKPKRKRQSKNKPKSQGRKAPIKKSKSLPVLDMTNIEPLSSEERLETASEFSEEDFTELMNICLEDDVCKTTPFPPKSSIKYKRSNSVPKGKPRKKLTPLKKKSPTPRKPKAYSALNQIKTAALKAKKKQTKTKAKSNSKSKAASKTKVASLTPEEAMFKSLGVLSPDSTATTFDFPLNEEELKADLFADIHLGSKKRRTKWRDEDTETLWKGILKYGNNWSEIKTMLPGRTYYQVKDKGRRLLHHKGWKTGRSKDDSCGAGECAKSIARSILAASKPRSTIEVGLGDLNFDNNSLMNFKLPSVAANA